MKPIFTIFFSLFVALTFAQAPPQGISYQAVARDIDGQALSDAQLSVRINILLNGANGDLWWQEEHDVVTNSLGLFSLIIGQGISTGSGNNPTFDTINWGAASYFLSVEIDPGDGVYELMGTSQFLSVPYAFYAESSGDSNDDDPDPSNELITSLSVENDSIVIMEGGIQHFLDIGSIAGEASLTDECISIAQLQGTDLNIVECGQAYVIPLESLVDDGDWTVEGEAIYNNQQDVGIGTSTPSSSLDLKGSLAVEISSVQGPINVNVDEDNCVLIANVTNGDVTVNLPGAGACLGRMYTFKIFASSGTNDFNLITVGSETIDGLNDPTIADVDNKVFSIISDGIGWWVINGSIAP